MLFRAIALSLALLFGIGTIIPFVADSTEAGPKYKKKKKKKLKKYSKAWWRWYKKEQRRKRVILARKRALRAKQILLARQRANRNKTVRKVAVVPIPKPTAALQAEKSVPVKNTEKANETPSELKFKVKGDNGNPIGSASLSVIMQAVVGDSKNEANKIGGVSTSVLRRNVVDTMVREEGWIVNDFQKSVNGKKVYVVIAQSSQNGVVSSRLFYFTEVGGRIYSLSATCPKDAQDRVAQESEKVIQSLQQGNTVTQVGQK